VSKKALSASDTHTHTQTHTHTHTHTSIICVLMGRRIVSKKALSASAVRVNRPLQGMRYRSWVCVCVCECVCVCVYIYIYMCVCVGE
jgi:hypothetical protein